MSADFGVSEMLAAEYARFLDGLSGLSDGGQRAARAAAARIRPGSVDVRTVQIPSWDDVIHLTPRPTITPEMRASYYAARRAGLASPLDPALDAEIERRGRRARAMQSSASPEYAKSYGQVMTAIDNVQDFLTTVTTAGRFVLSGSARLLDTLGPQATVAEIEAAQLAAEREATRQLARRALAGEAISVAARVEARALAREAALTAALRGLGGRTIGRLVPILGPILLAADILKALTLLGMWFFPAYAALCAGAGAGLAAAGLPVGQALLGKRAAKQKVFELGRANVFSRAAFLDRSRTIRQWRPSIYNLMEVAQTTDQLFGVGVSFGGIVGLVQDSLFGVEQQIRGQSVRVDASEVARTIHGMLAPGIATVPTPALADYRAASNVLAHGPVFQRVQETFTLEEHVDMLAAQLAAWSFLRPVMEQPNFEQAVNLALDVSWSPPLAQHEDTGAILREDGQLEVDARRWPLPGTPARVRGEDYVTATAAEIGPRFGELCAHHDDEPAGAFLSCLASHLVDRFIIVATGDPDGVKMHALPSWQLLESLALAGRVPNTGQDESRVLAFWHACLGEMARTERAFLTAAEYDAIAERTSCELFAAELPPS